MKPKFFYNHEDDYNGPYDTLDEAMAAAEKTAKPTYSIEILEVVAVSDIPKRTWKLR